jgi:threonine dehydrogenase-like Zn-dependent dehydrogenase
VRATVMYGAGDVRAEQRPDATVRQPTVIGDGAVGLSAVLAAKRLRAERIILMGRHTGAPTWAASSAPPTSSPSGGLRAWNGSVS